MADTPGLVIGDFDFGERMIDGNNSCNRSNRVGELDRLSKLDYRYVVVLGRIICSESLLCVNIKHLHSYKSLPDCCCCSLDAMSRKQH